MRRTGWAVLTMTALLVTPPLLAQRSGGRGPGGERERPGAAERQRGSGNEGERDRERARSTERQREQIRSCEACALRVRQEARAMERTVRQRGFDPAEARLRRDQLREQVRALRQEHQGFVEGLDDAQRSLLQERLRTMERTQQHMETRLQAMDRELDGDRPDGQRVAAQARELRRDMEEWRRQHRGMAAAMAAQ